MADAQPEIVPWSTHHVELHEDVVIKRFTGPTRGDVDREWTALVLLHAHSPGFAPEPLSRDEDTGAITMSRLPGTSVSALVALQPGPLARVVAALLHSLIAIPSAALDSLPLRSGHPSDYPPRICTHLVTVAPHPDPEVERVRLAAIDLLQSSSLPAAFADQHTPVFGVGDFNLANFVDDGATARMVDFEDSGRSDRATELADFVEHLSSRANPYSEWHRALGIDALSRDERQRYEATRILAAMGWLWLLFPGQPGDGRNPPGACADQAARLDVLMRDWADRWDSTRGNA